MYKGRGWTSVVPGVPHQPCRSGQDRGGVQGAGGEVVPELVAVIGKVSYLEHEADEEEREQNDPGPHQTNVEVELEVGLLVLGPGQRDVGQEPCDALVDYVGLEAESEQAVPEAPEAVTVNYYYDLNLEVTSTCYNAPDTSWEAEPASWTWRSVI